MYEVAIIGAGPAGIEAAKTSCKYGFKTVLIDKDKDNFGGLCLNKGCIPAKYYLNISKHSHNLKRIYNGKNKILQTIKNSSLDYLKRNQIEVKWGHARITSSNIIEVVSQTIEAKNIIIATGSLPSKVIAPDNKRVIFAEDVFSFTNLPSNFLIVGAGAVGLEIACLFNNLGKKVLVIEKEDNILPNFDKNVSRRLRLILEKKGIKINTSSDVNGYSLNDFDMVILATGRKPNLKDLDIKGIGLIQTEGGWLSTDKYLRTNIANIYAAGDITGKRLYAYVAELQGRLCVENIAGKNTLEDYCGLAECVFTQPQLAWVGVLEEEAKKKDIEYRIIKSNLLRFSSTYIYSDTDGFIQVLTDSKDRVIGAAIISNIASELISIFSLALRTGLTINNLRDATFIHPTLSEMVSKIFY